MKSMMQKQLAEVAKKVEDSSELDRLAQNEQDKQNISYDNTMMRKETIRKQLVKQAVFGNQEILKEKAWNRSMDHRQVRQDLALVNNDFDN
jgi:hypothetical protein